MISLPVLATILAMAAVTYLTRIGGYLVLRNRTLGPRATAVMDAAPGCVLIAVMAPHFVSPRPADLLALAITFVAALRLPMLAVVPIGIVAAASLRWLLG